MPKKIFITIAAELLLIACANEPPALHEIIKTQRQRYPLMWIQDYYKLAYQAALGNEHLMIDSAMVHHYLIEELQSIQASAAEPLLEEISPDREVVRLNLRPFKARNGDHRALFQAMMQTARTFPKSQERLEQYLDSLEYLAAPSGPIPYGAGTMNSYFREMREKGFPAVHHSAVYAEKYAPAYRVILKKYSPLMK